MLTGEKKNHFFCILISEISAPKKRNSTKVLKRNYRRKGIQTPNITINDFDQSHPNSIDFSTFDLSSFDLSSLEKSSVDLLSFGDSTSNSSSFEDSTFNNSTFEDSTFKIPTFEESTINTTSFEDLTLNIPSVEDSTFNISTFENSTFNTPSFDNSTFKFPTFDYSIFDKLFEDQFFLSTNAFEPQVSSLFHCKRKYLVFHFQQNSEQKNYSKVCKLKIRVGGSLN